MASVEIAVVNTASREIEQIILVDDSVANQYTYSESGYETFTVPNNAWYYLTGTIDSQGNYTHPPGIET